MLRIYLATSHKLLIKHRTHNPTAVFGHELMQEFHCQIPLLLQAKTHFSKNLHKCKRLSCLSVKNTATGISLMGHCTPTQTQLFDLLMHTIRRFHKNFKTYHQKRAFLYIQTPAACTDDALLSHVYFFLNGSLKYLDFGSSLFNIGYLYYRISCLILPIY